MYIRMYIMYVCIYVCMCIYVCTCVYKCVYVYVCIYIYTYIGRDVDRYIHIWIHKYIDS